VPTHRLGARQQLVQVLAGVAERGARVLQVRRLLQALLAQLFGQRVRERSLVAAARRLGLGLLVAAGRLLRRHLLRA